MHPRQKQTADPYPRPPSNWGAVPDDVWKRVMEELPSPTEDGTARFRELYLRRFGVELSGEEALRLATQTIQFVAMVHLYEFYASRTAVAREREEAKPASPPV